MFYPFLSPDQIGTSKINLAALASQARGLQGHARPQELLVPESSRAPGDAADLPWIPSGKYTTKYINDGQSTNYIDYGTIRTLVGHSTVHGHVQ